MKHIYLRVKCFSDKISFFLWNFYFFFYFFQIKSCRPLPPAAHSATHICVFVIYLVQQSTARRYDKNNSKELIDIVYELYFVAKDTSQKEKWLRVTTSVTQRCICVPIKCLQWPVHSKGKSLKFNSKFCFKNKKN